jgi:predicted DNA-binding protein (MmcQ/YjbR family)
MTLKEIGDKLHAAAIAYPGAYVDHPWGERVAKVGKKIFLFAGMMDGELHMSVKLPASGAMALSLPFAEPTGYNLGRSGWVSASFASARQVPVAMLLEWIEESYRAVAPKKLVKELEARAPAPRARAGGSRPRAARGPASRR